IDANSRGDALSRLETMVLMAGTDLPSRAVREQIVSAIHLLVHVRRYDDGVRRIESIAEITGLEGLTPLMQELYAFRRRGREGRRITGYFTATGVVPRMVDELREEGVSVPASLFQRSPESEPCRSPAWSSRSRPPSRRRTPGISSARVGCRPIGCSSTRQRFRKTTASIRCCSAPRDRFPGVIGICHRSPD